MTDETKPTAGKGRAHPLFPDRVGIAPAEEVSDPACWLPPVVGQEMSKRVWRNSGGEYQDDERTLVVESGTTKDQGTPGIKPNKPSNKS